LSVAGGCSQDTAEAEGGKDHAQVSTACWWQAMKPQSLTLRIINEQCPSAAELSSLNLLYKKRNVCFYAFHHVVYFRLLIWQRQNGTLDAVF